MTGDVVTRERAFRPESSPETEPTFACDAMCGGLVRWLRAYGVDTAYREGIADDDLVRLAADENRILISSDGPMFQRRAIRSGQIQHYRLERGLKLLDQFRVVVRAFRLRPGEARCSVCNGLLDRVTRAQVADRVPAKSLLWATKFFACVACGKAYWNGSHWRRIEAVRAEMERMVDALSDG